MFPFWRICPSYADDSLMTMASRKGFLSSTLASAVPAAWSLFYDELRVVVLLLPLGLDQKASFVGPSTLLQDVSLLGFWVR